MSKMKQWIPKPPQWNWSHLNLYLLLHLSSILHNGLDQSSNHWAVGTGSFFSDRFCFVFLFEPSFINRKASRLYIAASTTEKKSMCYQKCFNLLCWQARNTPTQGRKKADKQSHDWIQKQFLCGSLRFLISALKDGNTMCSVVLLWQYGTGRTQVPHVLWTFGDLSQLNSMLN